MMPLRSDLSHPLNSLLEKKRSFFLLTLALGVAVLLTILLAVSFGAVKIAPATAYQILLHKLLPLTRQENMHAIPPTYIDIIWQLRFPRVLMAAIVGAGLAVCGTIMQASVQNPLAEPYILGISAGASFGATFAILIGSAATWSSIGTPLGAFIGALAASLLVMLLSGIGGQMSTVKMVLSGTIAQALFLALSNCIIYLANNAEGIRSVTFWTMGSLAAAKWTNLALPALGVIVACVFFLTQYRILNAMLLGEEAALTLGIDLTKIRRNYLIITALITGLLVASCGVISFVGLIIPHIVRSLVGCDHRRLIPTAMLVGALFLTWADVLARIALPSGELPIGIITALIGAPFFMYILVKQTYGFGSR